MKSKFKLSQVRFICSVFTIHIVSKQLYYIVICIITENYSFFGVRLEVELFIRILFISYTIILEQASGLKF